MNVHFITFGILNQGHCSSTDCVLLSSIQEKKPVKLDRL